MPKVTYLLINTARGKYPTPLALSGHSGKVYGQAQYDPQIGHHAIRVPAEEWEAVPSNPTHKGMAEDISGNMHRSMQRWIIRAEVEPDLESPEGKHAQQVDELKARIAQLETLVENPPFVGREIEWPAPDAPIDAQESEPVGPTSTPVSAPDISAMGFDELDAMVDALNRDGANIQVEGQKSKVKLRAALNAHYAGQLTTPSSPAHMGE